MSSDDADMWAHLTPEQNESRLAFARYMKEQEAAKLAKQQAFLDKLVQEKREFFRKAAASAPSSKR